MKSICWRPVSQQYVLYETHAKNMHNVWTARLSGLIWTNQNEIIPLFKSYPTSLTSLVSPAVKNTRAVVTFRRFLSSPQRTFPSSIFPPLLQASFTHCSDWLVSSLMLSLLLSLPSAPSIVLSLSLSSRSHWSVWWPTRWVTQTSQPSSPCGRCEPCGPSEPSPDLKAWG